MDMNGTRKAMNLRCLSALPVLLVLLVCASGRGEETITWKWSDPQVITRYGEWGRVACVGGTVHIVWGDWGAVWWRHSLGPGKWSDAMPIWRQPKDSKYDLGVRHVDVAGTELGLHAMWLWEWGSYRCYDGNRWGQIQRIPGSEQAMSPTFLTVCGEDVWAFYTERIRGAMAHTHGRCPVSYCIRNRDGWRQSRQMPSAEDTFEAAATTDSKQDIHVVWGKLHTNFLGQNFGLMGNEGKMTLEHSWFSRDTNSWSRTRVFEGDAPCVYKLTAGPADRLYLLGWETPVRPGPCEGCEWWTYSNGKWCDRESAKAAGKKLRDRLGHYAGDHFDLGVDRHGVPFVVTGDAQGKVFSCVLGVGTPEETVIRSEPLGAQVGELQLGGPIQDIRTAAGPSGSIHVVTTHPAGWGDEGQRETEYAILYWHVSPPRPK